MGKKILIVGVGAQGSTVAKFIDSHPDVDEIICADADRNAVDSLVSVLAKGRGEIIDGTDKEAIKNLCGGVDLLVAALPMSIGRAPLDAAVEAGVNYQDFCAPMGFHDDWAKGFEIILGKYEKPFADSGKTALIGTGSAPGTICIAARHTMKYLDTCNTMYLIVYEGTEAKRFLPFWWSPETALTDMSWDAWAYVNNEVVRTKAYSLPIRRTFEEIGKEAEFYEHAHGESVYLGLVSDEFYKGAENIYFKYGGGGVAFAKPLYEAGLLSKEPKNVNGQQVVPFDVVLSCIPPAPKTEAEIKEIIDEGLKQDIGAMVVEAIGTKDGKPVKVESHVSAPGLEESFQRAGLTGEMYLTGQGGAMFTRMFIEDKIDQKGCVSTAMMRMDQVDYYLDMAAEIGITVSTTVTEL